MPEPRTKLPQGLPLPLADFVSCKVDRLDLAAERLDWLPKPKNPLIPDAPAHAPRPAGRSWITCRWWRPGRST